MRFGPDYSTDISTLGGDSVGPDYVNWDSNITQVCVCDRGACYKPHREKGIGAYDNVGIRKTLRVFTYGENKSILF